MPDTPEIINAPYEPLARRAGFANESPAPVHDATLAEPDSVRKRHVCFKCASANKRLRRNRAGASDKHNPQRVVDCLARPATHWRAHRAARVFRRHHTLRPLHSDGH